MRERVPGIALRTTALLGFPGETHSDFEELMQLAEEIRFEHLGGFAWSPEEGTAAMKLKEERVSEREARLRLSCLIELQEEISREKNERLIGQTLEIILDSATEGRTRANALEIDDIVNIKKSKGAAGTIRQAKITGASAHELDAILLN
jgi:ribosomal protein S12 methylthiotransferase